MSEPKMRARDLLLGSSAFANCPAAVIDELARRCRIVRYARGSVVYRQGDAGDSLMLVLSGSLKVTTASQAGKELVLCFFRPGALIGEIAALDGLERTATVVALEPTEAIVIQRRDLIPVLRGSPEAMLGLVEGLCARVRETNAIVESYALETEARVAASLVRLMEQHGRRTEAGTAIDVRLTQPDLGGYLGLTRETVSRTLTSLKEAGLIETVGASIVVLDVDELRLIAGGEVPGHPWSGRRLDGALTAAAGRSYR